MSEQPTAPPHDAEALRATERWFVQHGLPYFVPEEREAARSALHSRRTLLTLVLIPLTCSITNGIGVGVIVYVVLSVLGGRARAVPGLLWLLAAAFGVYFGLQLT